MHGMEDELRPGVEPLGNLYFLFSDPFAVQLRHCLLSFSMHVNERASVRINLC